MSGRPESLQKPDVPQAIYRFSIEELSTVDFKEIPSKTEETPPSYQFIRPHTDDI